MYIDPASLHYPLDLTSLILIQYIYKYVFYYLNGWTKIVSVPTFKGWIKIVFVEYSNNCEVSCFSSASGPEPVVVVIYNFLALDNMFLM